MKKTNIPVSIIAIFLFFIPFFWLKPGEMNLGGDSGRLYFYDPLSYLKYYTLYVYSSSGAGNEIFSYSSLFYTSVLFVFKLIFSSPTILISIFNGIVLSCAFLSIYFIVRELLNNSKNPIKKSIVVYSSILAGFLYIFSQLSIYSGWENAILSHNQIFLNPLIFLLLLKYFITREKSYMLVAILVSVIFAANFSFQGAPAFFAFYPLSLVYLICYVKFVKKLSIPFKELTFGIVLFLLAHSFHLIPEIARLFSFGSSLSKTVFIQEGLSTRMGLDYFMAVASSLKVSLVWLNAAQSQSALIFSIFIIFPITFIIGFYLNKGKTLLLTGIFFLVAMFFTSANITDSGFFLYKQLFKIPGFSMFRNYHGQWLYVYFFFYALVFGQAFAIIASKLSRRLFFIFFFVFTLVILGFGMPLITGAVSIVTHKENGIRYAFRMDPIYEKVLDYFRKYPIDEKIISFPITSPGFQIFQGKDGGVYQGIPTISFLSGKSDFSGFETLKPFNEIFLQAMYDKNYEVLKKILSVLNIGQIFYNSDPYIYSDNFQAYLYNYISKFSPKDQKEYKKFVEKIPENNGIDFGKNYHIYSLNADAYLPHIFIATEALYTNNQLPLSVDQYFSNDLRAVPLSIKEIASNKDRTFLYAQPANPFGQLTNNSHLHKHEPFISRKLSDPLYALTSVKERFKLYKLRNDQTAYMDLNLLFLEKRIRELNKFGEEIPVLKTSWHESKPWEFYNWSKYNSWDASLARYQQDVEKLIDWTNNMSDPETKKNENKIKISEQLYRHQVELLRLIISLNKENEEKTYIYSLVNDMFNKLFQKIQVPIYDPSIYRYQLPLHSNFGDSFNVLLAKGNVNNNALMKAYIKIGDQVLRPMQTESSDKLLAFTNYNNKNKEESFSLHLQPENLAKDIKWSNSGESVEADKSTKLIINNIIEEKTEGLMLNMPNWIPRNQYLISFEYMTSGDNLLFSFYDKKQINDIIKKRSYKLFFEKVLNTKTWKTHQSIVSAEDESAGAFLQFTAFSAKDKSKLQIKNLLITKISYPEIIFKKLSSGDTPQAIPKITFTKINPTKYRISVTDAASPYTLVFLEAFSEDWKLFNPEKNTESILGHFSRFFGIISKKIVSVFIKEDINVQTIASYFNGEVKEGKHTNTFLSPNTFETWGKEAIADARHYVSFDYANSWVINPEDVDEKKDYTLILEFIPQKKFYPALFISLLTLFFLVVYIVKIGILKK